MISSDQFNNSGEKKCMELAGWPQGRSIQIKRQFLGRSRLLSVMQDSLAESDVHELLLSVCFRLAQEHLLLKNAAYVCCVCSFKVHLFLNYATPRNKNKLILNL